MLVRSSIRGNVAAANSRRLSQVKKRYVTSARESGATALGHRVNEFQRYDSNQPTRTIYRPAYAASDKRPGPSVREADPRSRSAVLGRFSSGTAGMLAAARIGRRTVGLPDCVLSIVAA